jgi:hypothetical protein
MAVLDEDDDRACLMSGLATWWYDVTINGGRDQSNCASRYPARKLPASAESALARCLAVSGGGSGIFRL